MKIPEAKLGYGPHLESVRKYPFECKPLGLGYLTVSDLARLPIARRKTQRSPVCLQEPRSHDRISRSIDECQGIRKCIKSLD